MNMKGMERHPRNRKNITERSAWLLAAVSGVVMLAALGVLAPDVPADRAWRGEGEQSLPRLRVILPFTVEQAHAGVAAGAPFELLAGRAENTRCPNEMVDMSGYCIDRSPTRTFLNWYEAADQCQAQGKRLCTNAEWLQACDAAPLNGVEEMPGQQSEWLSNWVFEPSDQVFDALDRGYFRCRTSSHPWPTYRPYQIKWFRCCASQ